MRRINGLFILCISGWVYAQTYLPGYYLKDIREYWSNSVISSNAHVDINGDGTIDIRDMIVITEKIHSLVLSTAQINVDMDALAGISDVEVLDGSIEFTYSTIPDIAAGYLVYGISYNPEGFLRRVTQVVLPGSSTMTLITTPASLEDLIAEGAFGFRENLGEATIRKRTPRSLDLIDLNGTVLYDDSFSGETNGVSYGTNVHAEITTGTLSFSPDFWLDASFRQIYPGLEHCEFGISGQFDVDFLASVTANTAANYSGFEGNLIGPFYQYVTIPSTPRVMVTFEIWIKGGVDVDARVAGTLEAGFHAEAPVEFHGTFDGTNWTLGSEQNFIFEVTPPAPQVEIDISAKPYFYVSIKGKIYGITGPEIDLGTYLNSHTNYVVPPGNLSSTLYAGIYCDLGLESLFLNILEPWRVYEHQWLLWESHIGPLPIIDYFTATPGIVDFGQNSLLEWDTQNADSVEITSLGSFPSTGSVQVTPTETTTYALQALNPNGSSWDSASVAVNQPEPCPEIMALYPTGGPFTTGETVPMNIAYTGTPDRITIEYGGSQTTIYPPATAFNVTATGTPEYLTATAVTSGCGDSVERVYIPSEVDQPPPPQGVEEVDAIVGNLFAIPAGTFTQGSPSSEPCKYSNEYQFTHTLTRDMLVMETEVSRQMWADLKAVQPTLPSDPTSTSYGSGMNNPVQSNTWYEAVLFANLLSLERGLTRCYYKDVSFTTPLDDGNYTSGSFYCNFDANGYRLPSEGEWEYFTRAGTTGPFSIEEPNYTSGNCDSYITTPGTWPSLESVAWFCANRYDSAGYNTSKPVGSKEANPWGLKDVHGNVYEWCWDWYSNTYPLGNVTNYTGASSGSYRIFRGGSWLDNAGYCRSALRSGRSPYGQGVSIGFRLVRTYP